MASEDLEPEVSVAVSVDSEYLEEMDPETAERKAKMKIIREGVLAREAVFAQYAQEFGTKSRTRRIIEQYNRHEQGGYRCG